MKMGMDNNKCNRIVKKNLDKRIQCLRYERERIFHIWLKWFHLFFSRKWWRNQVCLCNCAVKYTNNISWWQSWKRQNKSIIERRIKIRRRKKYGDNLLFFYVKINKQKQRKTKKTKLLFEDDIEREDGSGVQCTKRYFGGKYSFVNIHQRYTEFQAKSKTFYLRASSFFFLSNYPLHLRRKSDISMFLILRRDNSGEKYTNVQKRQLSSPLTDTFPL